MLGAPEKVAYNFKTLVGLRAILFEILEHTFLLSAFDLFTRIVQSAICL